MGGIMTFKTLFSKTVVCDKCGKTNSNPSGKCTECGEYLYPFYKAQKRKALLTISIVILILFGLGSASLIIYYQTRDTLKADLIKYLKEIESANRFVVSTNDNILVNNSNLLLTSLEKIGDIGKNKWKESQAEKAFIEIRTKTESDLYSNRYKSYLRVMPHNPLLIQLHEKLLNAYKAAAKGHECFYMGMTTRTITNVKDGDDGYIRWRSSRHNSHYSDCYRNQTEQFEEDETEFRKKLIPLVEKKMVENEYDKAFPGELEIKNIITNFSDYVSKQAINRGI